MILVESGQAGECYGNFQPGKFNFWAIQISVFIFIFFKWSTIALLGTEQGLQEDTGITRRYHRKCKKYREIFEPINHCCDYDILAKLSRLVLISGEDD